MRVTGLGPAAVMRREPGWDLAGPVAAAKASRGDPVQLTRLSGISDPGGYPLVLRSARAATMSIGRWRAPLGRGQDRVHLR